MQIINTRNDSTTPEWLTAAREWESEGERSPSQVWRVVSLDYISGVADSPFEKAESES